MTQLFIFDMDGTLLPGTTSNIELAKVTGTLTHLQELERKFVEENLSTKDFAKSIFSLWGILDRNIIQKAFKNTPKLENIKAVLNDISGNGNISCLMTMSPDFYANQFKEYGFDYIFASQFPNNDNEKFDLSKILVPEDKPQIAEKLCTKLGINLKDAVAFGDSMSDYPLFKKLKYTVATNSDQKLKALAYCSYQGNDLMSAYKKIKRLANKQKRSSSSIENMFNLVFTM